MTDRYNALLVTLDRDIREDDAQCLINAIKQLRGVLKVEPNVVNCLDSTIAENRIRHELGKKLLNIVYPVLHKE